jgi:hypothetical protein
MSINITVTGRLTKDPELPVRQREREWTLDLYTQAHDRCGTSPRWTC